MFYFVQERIDTPTGSYYIQQRKVEINLTPKNQCDFCKFNSHFKLNGIEFYCAMYPHGNREHFCTDFETAFPEHNQ